MTVSEYEVFGVSPGGTAAIQTLQDRPIRVIAWNADGKICAEDRSEDIQHAKRIADSWKDAWPRVEILTPLSAA